MIDENELLFVVDENNNPIEPRPRIAVHQEGYWHRNSHVWVVDDQKQILCQRRSLLKDSNPGKWESFFGGHLGPNAGYLDGAITEIGEELGIPVDVTRFKLWNVYKNETGKEFQAIFIYRWNGDSKDIQFEREEIDQISWIPTEEVMDLILVKRDSRWSYMGYENELLPFILSLFDII